MNTNANGALVGTKAMLCFCTCVHLYCSLMLRRVIKYMKAQTGFWTACLFASVTMAGSVFFRLATLTWRRRFGCRHRRSRSERTQHQSSSDDNSKRDWQTIGAADYSVVRNRTTTPAIAATRISRAPECYSCEAARNHSPKMFHDTFLQLLWGLSTHSVHE